MKTIQTAVASSDEAIQLSVADSVATMDSLAEPVIGRRFAPTRWLAMTLNHP
jgi:hypothetical protein